MLYEQSWRLWMQPYRQRLEWRMVIISMSRRHRRVEASSIVTPPHHSFVHLLGILRHQILGNGVADLPTGKGIGCIPRSMR